METRKTQNLLRELVEDNTSGATEFINKVLEIIVEIKSLINIPLNNNHLIFTDKEEFDPHAYKNEMKKRMTERG